MHRHSTDHLDFITTFVDSVTVRPFFEDLRRVKRYALRRSPHAPHLDQGATEAA